jgi:hypothetical protein
VAAQQPSAPAVVSPAAPKIAPAVEPTTVTLDIQSEPQEVDVLLGDKKLGSLPGDSIRVDRGDELIELTIQADGYEPSKLSVKPSANAVLSVKLKRKAVPAAAPAPRPKPKGGGTSSDLEF